jgi:uncharacterized protein
VLNFGSRKTLHFTGNAQVGARSAMALEMREGCEKCHKVLQEDGPATICSFECTFCVECAKAMNNACPNCKGELVARPRRTARTSNG